ncbi:MAG: 1,4-beta-xylanase, partial [Phycisphaeraceae bacterium JB051]
QPKPAYHTLNNLIHHEWKTNLTAKADSDGALSFRGFRGSYRLSWTDSDGNAQTQICEVK